MTTYVGNDGTVLIGANAIAEIKAFSVEETADRVEDTALGDSNRTYKAGLQDVSGTLECHFDPGDATGQELLGPGDNATLLLRPNGTGSGLPEWSVSATVLSNTLSVAFNEINARTITWAAAGTLSKGTQP